jgi:hypothetical protein
MNKPRQTLSLDRPAAYQIKVPGELDKSWSDWFGGMAVSVESKGDGLPIDDRTVDDRPVTTLTGTVDQAALQGVLRKLYSLGLPLMSVHCIEDD